MSRNVSRKISPLPRRETSQHEVPAPERKISYAENPDVEIPIAWNFGRMDDGGKFKCTLKLLAGFTNELIKLEGKTVSQLMQKAHNHPMAVGKLSSEAKARLEILNLEEETLFQLDLKTPARLWGILEHNIFYILWLDPTHDVYIAK